MSASVCLYVCANKQRVQTSQIFVRATCDRVLLVVLSFYGVAIFLMCTSGFVDDVLFGHNDWD